jgi:Galactose oxidase, central domain
MKHIMATIGCVCLLSAGLARCGERPDNQWVRVGPSRPKDPKVFASTCYMPGTDTFFLWGLSGKNTFDTETLSVKTGLWTAAKAKTFSQWPQKVRSSVCINGQILPNRVAIKNENGFQRPGPCPTFHQVTYDTKRERVLLFVGGKTFSYDPRKKLWTNLKPRKSPTACGALTWAGLCYDPVNDEALLFGGGMALNLWGGAYTWLYDCRKNTWRELKQARDKQPPLRCNTQMVFDSRNKVVVLFGGDAMNKALADTWVYDVKTRSWRERKPKSSPPPMAQCGMAYHSKHGLIVLVGGANNTWVYDAARNVWTPIKGRLFEEKDRGAWFSKAWFTCAYSPKSDRLLLVGMGPRARHNTRLTWSYSLEPATARDPQRKGVPPGTTRYRLGVWPRLKKAPPPNRSDNLKRLRNIPVNKMIQAKAPASVVNKTWTTATMDTDRGEVIYTGGGHSGYSGDDWAHYNVADNRWSMSWPPRVAPFLWATNVRPYGWSYGAVPWSTHNRHTYLYDPLSKQVFYFQGIWRTFNGQEFLLSENSEDAFVLDPRKYRSIIYLYDPVAKKMKKPVFMPPINSGGTIGRIGTPHGIFSACTKGLYRYKLVGDKIEVKKVGPAPPPVKGSGYDGEVHTLIYDSKRDRVLLFYGNGPQYRGKKARVDIVSHKLGSKDWRLLKTSGYAELSREPMYIAKHDVILMMGKGKLLVLNCKTNRWQTLDVEIPKTRAGAWDLTAVYDPVHDVAVFLHPRSFGKVNRVFLFRYDPRTAKYKAP